MYSQNNYRYTNQQPKGTVADFFDYFSNLIDKNDGTRSFIYRTTDCYNSDAPFDMSQESRIMITAPDFDITNISDSYITMKVNLKLQLNTALKELNDPDRLMKVFVGWRCSNQILDQLQIVSNNNNTGYLSDGDALTKFLTNFKSFPITTTQDTNKMNAFVKALLMLLSWTNITEQIESTSRHYTSRLTNLIQTFVAHLLI